MEETTESAFPTFVLFSSDIPKVESHKMAVNTKVESERMALAADDKPVGSKVMTVAFLKHRLGFIGSKCLW
jgi:hypothetical protein